MREHSARVYDGVGLTARSAAHRRVPHAASPDVSTTVNVTSCSVRWHLGDALQLSVLSPTRCAARPARRAQHTYTKNAPRSSLGLRLYQRAE